MYLLDTNFYMIRRDKLPYERPPSLTLRKQCIIQRSTNPERPSSNSIIRKIFTGILRNNILKNLSLTTSFLINLTIFSSYRNQHFVIKVGRFLFQKNLRHAKQSLEEAPVSVHVFLQYVSYISSVQDCYNLIFII